jgi:hypothetical protein
MTYFKKKINFPKEPFFKLNDTVSQKPIIIKIVYSEIVLDFFSSFGNTARNVTLLNQCISMHHAALIPPLGPLPKQRIVFQRLQEHGLFVPFQMFFWTNSSGTSQTPHLRE